MDECALGCRPHGALGECPRDCPCECHRQSYARRSVTWPDCGYDGEHFHDGDRDPNCGMCQDQGLVPLEDRAPASLPRPGEVIPRPYDDLALEKVAPEEQRTILDAMKAPAVVDMPDPFDDPDIPDELRRKHPDVHHP